MNRVSVATRYLVSSVIIVFLILVMPPNVLAQNDLISIQSYVVYHSEVGQQEDHPHRIYVVPLKEVERVFSDECKVKGHVRADLQKLKETSPALYREGNESAEQVDPYTFFQQLLNKQYSYVVVDDKIIFTRIYPCPIYRECKVDKHMNLCHQKDDVQMAGEFGVYPYPDEDKVAVVIDNNSGSYQPGPERAPRAAHLLEENVGSNHVVWISKDHKQIFNPVTMKVEGEPEGS